MDPLVRIGFQSLCLPKFSEIHISITFSWDIEFGKNLQAYWRSFGKVRLGGPAFKSPCNRFQPGKYVKQGIVFTSRGCNFRCPWCLVPEYEGRFRTIPIQEGNIIQDNNILLANRNHLEKVFAMLRKQTAISFKGGLDIRLLKDWHIQEFRSLRIQELWLALDEWERRDRFREVCFRLIKAGFRRNQIRAYCLAGYEEEPIQACEDRLKFIYKCGALPFIQVYQDPRIRTFKILERDKDFVRKWSRPAIIKTIMRGISP
ncbi:MAG: hypothetical protein GTN37_02620 [Candidatus Aenigmarchaeota archaeon]|nr:hypothetical protein [Candidatus Aenigmarchaeota archaeon]NIS73297.1 hypothetical protein [Candidatus Aenigmarchaeota archaeon]